MNVSFHRKRQTLEDLVASREIAPVARFRGHSNGLTKQELHALWSVVLIHGHDWLLETEVDGSGDLWAVLGPRLPETNGYTAYLISKKQGHFRLIEAGHTGFWRLMGEYHTISDLRTAICRFIMPITAPTELRQPATTSRDVKLPPVFMTGRS